MTLFFFVIALELKRELVHGELRNPRVAALPVAAAFGGMLVPAGVFLLVVGSGPGASGLGTRYVHRHGLRHRMPGEFSARVFQKAYGCSCSRSRSLTMWVPSWSWRLAMATPRMGCSRCRRDRTCRGGCNFAPGSAQYSRLFRGRRRHLAGFDASGIHMRPHPGVILGLMTSGAELGE